MCGIKENTGGTACVWVAGTEHYSGFRTQGSECQCHVRGGGWSGVGCSVWLKESERRDPRISQSWNLTPD